MSRDLVRTICPYCGVGCNLNVVVEDGRVVGIDYLKETPLNEGALCPKGNASIELLNHPDRVLYPQRRTGSGWKRIDWDDALDMVAENLARIRAEHGPDAVGFFCSAKCTNEENYLLQKLARMFGTNNVDHCARL